MNSPELRLFAEYNYLRELISTKKSSSLHDLSLCNRDHTNIPPPSLLFYFSGLRSLAISHNQINIFSASDLLRGAPMLEKLDFSYNNITTFDDLVELGSSKTLRSLNITGNPISNQHARIQQIEHLLFPKKYRSYNPVEILTATYNLSSVNIEAKKKFDIVINKVPGSSKSKRGQYIPEEPQGKAAKLIQEMCPIPRKTRFAYLGIFNEEIISVGDMQTILVNKDISSVLFEKKENQGPTFVRSEKLHQRYVESYTRRKARGKEQIDVIPSLEKLSHMIRNNDNMDLIYSQDRIRYDKLKLKKVDYEEELWKGPLDSQLQEQEMDFMISIAQMKREAREYDEKKEAQAAYKKEYPKAVKERDRPDNDDKEQLKKKVWKKKQGTGREITSMNSLESSIPEHHTDNVKKTIGLSEEDSRKETEDIPETSKDRDIEEVEGVPEDVVYPSERVPLRARSQSLPKFNKVSNRNRQVAFDNEGTLQEGEESLAMTQIVLHKVRRTNSELVGALSRNILTPSLTFDELKLKSVTVDKPKSAASKQDIHSTRRFVVVQDSAPNVGLPLFMNNKKPGHKRSASVQPTQRMAAKDVPIRPESVSGEKPVIPELHQLSNFNLQDREKRSNSQRNRSISERNLPAFPSIDYSKIKEENSSEQPFFSSNQGFNSMRSFDLESKNQMESENKSNRKDSIIDDVSKISFITPGNSSRYRSGSASPYEIASSLGLLNSAVPGKKPLPSQDEIITSIVGRPKKKLVEGFDRSNFGSEDRGSRPNTSKSAADLYNEIQHSLVAQKIASKQMMTGRNAPRNSDQGNGGTLKISNFLGCFSSEKVNRGQNNRSPGATVQQQKERRKIQRIRGQELGTLSPHTSFLSSQLSKNNNHSLVHIRRLRGTTGNFTSRGGLEIQGEQLEEAVSAISGGKNKPGPKEEIGLDSTKAFSAAGQSGRKMKSRSGSAENIISLNSVVSSGVVVDRRIRNIRLKQVL